MKLFGWIRGRKDRGDNERRRWREAWAAAVAAEDPSTTQALKTRLEALPVPAGVDNEMELEMLDALETLATLRRETANGGLPLVETQHRVLAGAPCHFTAPASLADDHSQSSGRVLFTPSRSLFVGAGQSQPVAWHSVREVIQSERDLMLVRGDGTAAAHFRFNTYGDAVAAAFLARRLSSRGMRPR